MTMRLTIKNTDPMRTARVTYVDLGALDAVPTIDIAPGVEVDVWIHSTRAMRVEEVQPVAEEAPPVAS
jgi:hypothetical protein